LSNCGVGVILRLAMSKSRPQYFSVIKQTGKSAPGLAGLVRSALHDALTDKTRLTESLLRMPGMSGRRYRIFINALIGALVPDARYLEVGIWQGSTLCSAITGHPAKAIAIDNWSEFGGPRDAFQQHLQQFVGDTTAVRIIDDDFRRVDFSSLEKSNVFLFDGPHQEVDQFDGIVRAQPALDRHHVLIVDDWNLEWVRAGTFRAFGALPIEVKYLLEIRTTLDNTHPEHHSAASDWHDGYMVAVIEKK
jgi:hypothetical protein